MRNLFFLIILFGFVSLFGDIAYEGARSIIGPFLFSLGATASIVGLVCGIGEFLGYSLRFFSGYFSDRTKSYWLFTITGYSLILSIPFLGFAKTWQFAAIFIILERIGKAIRTPSRDTILSYATKKVGRGFGFGIHEAFDQLGAIIGPLIFTLILMKGKSYSYGFRMMFIPVVILISILLFAKRKYPEPEKFEVEKEKGENLPFIFFLYVFFTFLSTAGFINFQLISYHLKFKEVIKPSYIPLFYLIAMGIDGISALIIGKIYDKKGLKTLIILPFIMMVLPFFVFTESVIPVVSGIILWGISMGIQETIIRAAIADITPIKKRGIAYGIFNLGYGAGWFAGSSLVGFFYQNFKNLIYVYVILVEICSLLILKNIIKKNGN